MNKTRRAAMGLALDGSHAEIEEFVRKELIELPTSIAEAVLPFVHRRIDELWSSYVVVMLGESVERLEEQLERLTEKVCAASPERVRCVDHLELQEGLDMFYPLHGGLGEESKLIQAIEYVRSFPETKAEYYETQTTFSGPAMRRLHSRDRNGRFIGFEIVRRLYQHERMLELDVIHLSGFTLWQTIKCIPYFRAAFQKAAEDIGEPSGRAIMKGWDRQRVKHTFRIRQLHACTRASYLLETGAERSAS